LSPDPRRLSALIVNYNSGAFAAACVESLIHEWAAEGRDPAALEVVLIDNASPEDQEEHLQRCEQAGVAVLRSEENLGYAGGMNRCLARTRGAAQDVVAVLNPDLFFRPGNIGVLMDYLTDHPECGVVAPRATIDPGQCLILPKNPLPTPLEELRVLGGQVSPALCRAYSRRRVRYTLPWWASDEPLVTDMLSGCCLFLRRAVIEELPALMDERFPLYYEDTDLFRALDERGYTIVQHTGTTILHHWSRSSGFGESFLGEPMRRYRLSRGEYYRKYYGPLGWGLVRCMDAVAKRWPARLSHRPMVACEFLGVTAEPPELRLPRHARFAVEVALRPDFQLAVGVIGEGDRWVCPEEAWTWFFDVDYYLRVVDVDTGEVLGAWQFKKTTPGRHAPLSGQEVAQLRGQREELAS
jgi:GT2 family glycosyltransferase